MGHGPPVGHRSTLQWATEHFGLKKSYLHDELLIDLVWKLADFFVFFLEITWFWQKKKTHQSNSRLIKIWIKFVYCCFKLPKKPPPPLRNPGYATAQDSGKLQLSSTLRIGPWKIFQNENGPRLEKGWDHCLKLMFIFWSFYLLYVTDERQRLFSNAII